MKRRPGLPLVKLALVGILPMWLKRIYYRARGATIGKNVSLGWFTVIDAPAIELLDDAAIAPFSFVRCRGPVKMGKRSRINSFVAIDTGRFELGDDSKIAEMVAVGGMLSPRSALIIGKRVAIHPHSFLNPTEPIVLEDDAGLATGTYVFTHGSWRNMLDGFPGTFGAVTFKRGSYIGARTFVRPGVTIGEYSAIGTGSVVTRSIPDRVVAVGAPCQVIKAENIQQYTLEQKNAFVLDWLREFAEFLVYLQYPARYESAEESASIAIDSPDASGPLRLVYERARSASPVAANVVVVLEPLTPAQRDALTLAGTAWFDIAGKSCFLVKHPLCDETRQFFSRFGVRFEPVN